MGFLVTVFLYGSLWSFLMLFLCLAVIYAGAGILKISRDEIAGQRGSLLPLAFSAWTFAFTAMAGSLLIMLILSMVIPYFSVLYSEWHTAYDNAYVQLIIFCMSWAALYILLLLPARFRFKRFILHDPKRKKLFSAFWVFSALWLGVSSFAACTTNWLWHIF
ncbi:MAG: hypothetical protein ACYCX2_12130 [Christensenellales bacterium]